MRATLLCPFSPLLLRVWPSFPPSPCIKARGRLGAKHTKLHSPQCKDRLPSRSICTTSAVKPSSPASYSVKAAVCIKHCYAPQYTEWPIFYYITPYVRRCKGSEFPILPTLELHPVFSLLHFDDCLSAATPRTGNVHSILNTLGFPGIWCRGHSTGANDRMEASPIFPPVPTMATDKKPGISEGTFFWLPSGQSIHYHSCGNGEDLGGCSS